MAKHAAVPLDAPLHRQPHVRWPDESDATAEALNTLIDISVDDSERRLIIESRFKARIQIALHMTPEGTHPSFLDFIGRHAAGRGMVSSLLDDGTLLMTLGVPDASDASQQLVKDFATGAARALGRGQADITEASIIEVDDARLHRALVALGVRRPDLKSV
ncbi:MULTISPECIES: hypothetical protein [Mycobacteroides]|nr:hypothetical protein [Mycobacteroides abscessus]